MICSERQARLVQERRYAAQKGGVSKAVRRFYLREFGTTEAAYRLPHRFQPSLAG